MTHFDIVLRAVIATALGGIVGLERESKHRPAGFRTHILVCLGSMSVMVLSKLMFIEYYETYGMLLDPQRISAQVISGVGFLGAGTIIHAGQNVKGLTTAASLWAVAAIGLSIGAGFYFLSIVVTIVICIALAAFNKISLNVMDRSNIIELVVELINKPKTLGAISLLFAKNNVQIMDMAFLTDTKIADGDKEIISVRFIIKVPIKETVDSLIDSISEITGVLNIQK